MISPGPPRSSPAPGVPDFPRRPRLPQLQCPLRPQPEGRVHIPYRREPDHQLPCGGGSLAGGQPHRVRQFRPRRTPGTVREQRRQRPHSGGREHRAPVGDRAHRAASAFTARTVPRATRIPPPLISRLPCAKSYDRPASEDLQRSPEIPARTRSTAPVSIPPPRSPKGRPPRVPRAPRTSPRPRARLPPRRQPPRSTRTPRPSRRRRTRTPRRSRTPSPRTRTHPRGPPTARSPNSRTGHRRRAPTARTPRVPTPPGPRAPTGRSPTRPGGRATRRTTTPRP